MLVTDSYQFVQQCGLNIACSACCLVIRHLVPSIFYDYFNYNRGIHSHSMRKSNYLHIITPNTTYGKRCIKVRYTVLWNDLPYFLKVYGTVRKFKTHSKIFLFSYF